MQKKPDYKTIQFRGGFNSYNEPALMDAGQFSAIQNFRQMHPGIKKRPGQIKLHTEADSTNRVMSMFQFSKGKTTERHFYAQMSDGDVLEATAGPPTVTTGAFGSEVHDGTSSGMIPASWSNYNDMMVYSNGTNQHQLYFGQTARISRFIVYKGAATIPDFPILGQDFTDEVTDGVASTVAVLDSLGDLGTDYDCIFIGAPVPINKLTFTVTAANGTEAAAQMKYRKNDSTWAAVASFSDGTSASSKAFAQTGSMTWTKPTDSIPTFMYDTYCYWYQLSLSSGDLDSETEVSEVTCESNWNALTNMWDGVLLDGVEAQFYDVSAGTCSVYSSDSITLDEMATDDYLYVAFTDPLEALYFDVGVAPSTTGSNTIDGLDYWNGAAWASVGSFTDLTIGLTQSGFIVLPKRAAGLEFPQNFNSTQYNAYWYRISVNKALSDNTDVGVFGIPMYDISDFGSAGLCNAVWKYRMVYTFNDYPNYIYISATNNPQCLNGDDYDIKEAGDGRGNKIVCMRPFYNELLVFQEEKGVEGGCITLFDGYDPASFGRLLLSSRYGTMNAQSAEVVEGFTFGGQQQASLICFFLSREGIMYTEGKTVSVVPNFEAVKNYFDQTDTTDCIRTGYEKHMWLKYDSAFNVLRIGLVTGSSATVCNTFLTYDLADLTWGTDSYAQELASFCEVEAASGNIPVLQCGGGVDDGTLYLCNNGLNDVTTAIDSYATAEFDSGGDILQFDGLMLRMKTQSAGSVTVTPYLNSIAGTAKTLAQTVETASETIRRHTDGMDIRSQHISLKFQHNTKDQSAYLLDYRPSIRVLTER